MTTTTTYHSPADAIEEEPFTGFEQVLDGDPAARVAWLRTESAGDGMLLAGMFSVQPSTFRYVFGGDETLYVLEGSCTIVPDGGDPVELHGNDVASFRKGTTSTWTVTSPLRKFFVISG